MFLFFNPDFISSYDVLELVRVVSDTDLVGDVVDGDVMHGCRVTLKQSMKVSPTMSETEDRLIIHIVIQNTCGPKRLNNEALITLA